jgi:hypothetical protein
MHPFALNCTAVINIMDFINVLLTYQYKIKNAKTIDVSNGWRPILNCSNHS